MNPRKGHKYLSNGERWGLIMLGFILGQIFMIILFRVLKSTI